MFENYESEFNTALSGVKNEFTNFEKSPDDTQKKAIVETLKKGLTECEKKIKDMETEASFSGGPILMNKIRKHRNEYDDIRKKVGAAESTFMEKVNRKELFGQRKNDEQDGVKDPRTRVIDSNDKLFKQNVTLTGATLTANEIDERTRAINEELLRQRQGIEHGINSNKEIGKELNRTNYLEDTMSRRECMSKSMLWIAVLALTGVNVFLLIRRLVNS